MADKKTNDDYGVKFESGGCYKHRSGGKLKVVGFLRDENGGPVALMGRTQSGRLFEIESPLSLEKNYCEISREEFKQEPISEEAQVSAFGWDELTEIKFRAMDLSKATYNPFRKQGLLNLATAADYLHAMIARTQRSGKITTKGSGK